ncbi:MAG: DUF5050 domain-containing protein [Coprobacillus sp.]|nr:DUF5050 domain-containing protein [Coprobacillus sp.]
MLKKNIRKSFSLVLLTFILTISGCTGSSDTSTSSESKGSETTTSEDTQTSESSENDSSTSEDTGTSESTGGTDSSPSEEDPTIHVESISISPSSLSLTVGDSTSVSVSINPSNATDKTYTLTSSNDSVASVDSNGVVTAISVGTTTITATSNDGGKSATCSVSVTAASEDTKEIEGVYFNSASFEYDSFEHSIEVEGTVLDEYNISYSCTNDSSIQNKASEIGTYNINASISAEGYHTKTLSATLTIYANDDVRYIKYFNNKVYFENALDNDYLYTYDGSSVTKVSNDQARYFATDSTNIYYTAKSLFSGSIKKVDSSDEVSTAAEVKGDYLAVNGNYAYYVVNGLLASNSGIYKISLTDENAEPTLLSQGKAYYLTYYNNTLYFADGSNSNKLSSISTSGSNQNRTVVGEGPKINNLIVDNGVLYYTVNNWLGNYIEKYTISTNSKVKLTSDAGENLVVIGNTLYYENVDKLNTLIYGDGIYSVSTNQTSDNNNTGTHIIENGTICSLASYGSTGLIYYDLTSDYDLCIYDLNSKQVTTHILEGFTATDESNIVNTGGETKEYNGKIYYLNMYDNKTLYAYSPASNTKVKIISNKVNNFSIIGDWLYFNEVTWLVNNNLYRVNLKEGGEPELVNSYDCEDICSDGEHLYYVQKNAAMVRTAIRMSDMNGDNDVQIYSSGVDDLKVYNGKLYFIDSYNILSIDPSDTSYSTTTIYDQTPRVSTMDIEDGVIYFRQLYGVLWGNKRLCKINVDGSNFVEMITDDTDPEEIIVRDGTIYYYNQVESASILSDDTISGLYKAGLSATSGTQILRAFGSSIDYYTTALEYYNGYIYFLNSDGLLGAVNTNGNAHFYRISVNGGTPELIS